MLIITHPTCPLHRQAITIDERRKSNCIWTSGSDGTNDVVLISEKHLDALHAFSKDRDLAVKLEKTNIMLLKYNNMGQNCLEML